MKHHFKLATIAVVVALGLATTLTACDVTGVAAPSGQSAHTGDGVQYLGEPGAHAP